MPSTGSYHWSAISELKRRSEGQKAKPGSPGAPLHSSMTGMGGRAQGGPESWRIQEQHLWTERRDASSVSCLLTSGPWFLWDVYDTISDALSGIHCIILSCFLKLLCHLFHFPAKWILRSLGSLKGLACSLATMNKFSSVHLMHTWFF